MSTAACSVKLEQVGYNVANFRIPDERGYVAKDEVIHEGEPDHMTTQVPLEEMLTTLRATHLQVDISTDPGRYVCNYVYYRSLVWAKRQATTKHSKVRCCLSCSEFEQLQWQCLTRFFALLLVVSTAPCAVCARTRVPDAGG